MARVEATFQTEFYRSLRSLPDYKFYHNIRDDGFQNPFDAMMTYGGVSYALEYKISKNHISIPLFELFRDRSHEIRALRRNKKAGGRGYVLVNVFVARKINTVYVIDVDDYVSLCRRVLPKKSIKLTDPILKNFPQMPKIATDTGKIWNLNTIINYEPIQKALQESSNAKKERRKKTN